MPSAAGRDDQAGDGRADGAGDVDHHRVEADRVAQFVGADHLEHERLPGRVLEALFRPSRNASTKTSQSCTTWVTVSPTGRGPSTPIIDCRPIISLRLSTRSAMTPPYGPSSSTGSVCSATDQPDRRCPSRSAAAPARTGRRSASRCRPARSTGRRSTAVVRIVQARRTSGGGALRAWSHAYRLGGHRLSQ